MIDTLIPGEALIYERANGVVYARYRDPPHSLKPRWIIGGSNEAFDRATNNFKSPLQHTNTKLVNFLVCFFKKYKTSNRVLVLPMFLGL